MASDDEQPLDYFLRHLFRQYAKTFHTPLHIVETLPLEQVLLHYYENLYEELVKEDKPEFVQLLEKEKIRLTETKEEREIRLEKERLAKEEDEEWLTHIEEENKQQAVLQAKRLQKQTEQMMKALEKDFLSTSLTQQALTYNGPLDFKAGAQVLAPEVTFPAPIKQSISQGLADFGKTFEQLRELDTSPEF